MAGKKPKPPTKPTVFTKAVRDKMEEGYTRGFTTGQVAMYAGVSRAAVYLLFNREPEYKEHCDELKGNILMLARNNIYEKIVGGDDHTTKWFLERRDKAYIDKKYVESDISLKGPTVIEIVAGTKEP
jgi:hypothetical protein